MLEITLDEVFRSGRTAEEMRASYKARHRRPLIAVVKPRKEWPRNYPERYLERQTQPEPIDLECKFAKLRGKGPIKTIIELAAQCYGVDAPDVVGNRRFVELIKPRQIAMFLAFDLTGWGKNRVGRSFNRDHTTVLDAIKKISKRSLSDRALALELSALRARLES